MREGRRNIQYLEERLQELQARKLSQGMDNMNLGGHRNDAPAPPPKDSRGSDRGGYGTPEYSQIGGHGDMMPPRGPYAAPPPGSAIPKARPNFTKLGV
jgi:hypothetical protein